MPIEPPADDRAKQMTGNPRRYFTDARERAEGEVIAERAGRPRHREFHGMPVSRPAPGVVRIQVTGSSDDDVQGFVEELRADGYQVWPASRKLLEHRDGTVFRYFTVELKGQQR
jgi:hypothetical protein